MSMPSSSAPGERPTHDVTRTPAATVRATEDAGIPRGHIPALDGIRGIAVLGVMLCHFTSVGLPNSVLGKLVRRPLEAGWSGVDLFFVLSGFLITGILYDAKTGPHYFRRFYLRRALRIFPLYFGFLIVFFGVLPHVVAFTPAMHQQEARQGWLWIYGTNLIMAREARWLFIADWMELAHFWTLAIEEQFYFVWPLVIFALSRRGAIRACLAVMAVAVVLRTVLVLRGAHPITVGMFTLCRADALAMGALAALLARGDARALFHWTRRATPALCAALLLLVGALKRWDAANPVVQSVGFTLLGLCLACALVRAIEPRGPERYRRFLAHPILRWFGTYSYGMYVFHVALLPFFARLAPVPTLSARLGSPYLGVLAHVLVATSISCLIAYVSYHGYEKHFLRLKTRFEMGRPTAPAAELAERLGDSAGVVVGRR
jgi:peptidoglycan/LPS O-acetylase OafA/YrhL